MVLKKFTLSTCFSLFSCIVFAQDYKPSVTDNLVDTFLNCDSQFFHYLAENKQAISEYVDLTTKDNVTFIPVESIYQPDKNSVNFKKTFEYRGLKIIGYQNIFIPTNLSGQYYYWGFIFDNNQDEIVKNLDNLKWSRYNEKVYIANSKIYDRNTKIAEWKNNPYSIDSVVPRLGTIEKALYLENVDNKQNSILCSIQGDLNKELLYKDRPDIKPLDEEFEKNRQEKIKAYKLKKQKEQQEKKAVSQNQPQPTKKQ